MTFEGTEGAGATFVLGSAVPHPYALHLGSYSVHTSAAALAAGERHIRKLKQSLDATGDRRAGSGSTPCSGHNNQGGPHASPIEENKVLIRRFFTAIESGDLRVFDEIVAEDYDDHLAGQSPGRETLKQYFTGFVPPFRICNCRFRRSSPRANRVAVLNAVRGTHKGEFIGLKATGRRIDAMAFQLYRIHNGQLSEHWEVADFATLMQQLQG